VEKSKDTPRRSLHASFVKKFIRPDVSFRDIQELCKRNGWKFSGRSGQPGGNRGSFQKGHNHRGFKNYEKVEPDGSITVGGYDEAGKFRTRRKHRTLWEQKYGPIPNDCVLKCKGDRSNPDPSNWVIIKRGATKHLSIRGYDAASAELRPTILAVATLNHQIHHAPRDR
jgi:hypothetical protein